MAKVGEGTPGSSSRLRGISVGGGGMSSVEDEACRVVGMVDGGGGPVAVKLAVSAACSPCIFRICCWWDPVSTPARISRASLCCSS